MKKINSLLFAAALFAAIGITINSCAPTDPNEQDTTTLLTTQSSLSLTAADSTDSSFISLSCGCKFGPVVLTSGPLKLYTQYGDTSVIHFSMNDIDSSLYTHTLRAAFSPTALKSPGSDTAWIVLYFLDEGKYPLYDTIRVIANY
jgi:hypothetical protein